MVMAAEAIEYAHREGVWHLDLKPANLMLDVGGHCWIIDFGIAQRVDGEADEPAPRQLTETLPTNNETFASRFPPCPI